MVRPAVSPDSCSSRLLRRLIELEIVFQLVSMPPSQRWLTKCWPARLRGLGDRVLGLALGADEQHLAAAGDGLLDEVERAREQRHGLRQIDDVDAVAVAEDVRLHLGVPAVGLVAEMRSGLEQLLHGDDSGRHRSSPSGFASTEPSHQPCGRHRYVGSACGMRAPLAERLPLSSVWPVPRPA